MRSPAALASCPLVLLLLNLTHAYGAATPAENYQKVTVVNILGHPQHARVVGPGYVPSKFIDKDLRFAFSGDDWDKDCLEAPAGDTTNGKLAKVTDSCEVWKPDSTWKWDSSGQIIHAPNSCLDLSDPETLLDAPELGKLNLVQFYTCDGGKNQQWVVLRAKSKIANVARPDLCLSPLGHEKLLVAVDCRNAKNIGVTEKKESEL